MRKYRFCQNRDKVEEDFEINITSVIDCLTVLILYVLVGASFLTIGAIDLGMSRIQSQSIQSPTKTPLALFIQLESNKTIHIILTGVQLDTTPNQKVTTLPPYEGTWNLHELENQLTIIQKKWPALAHANLTADDKIHYIAIVKSLESLRKVFPAISILNQLIEFNPPPEIAMSKQDLPPQTGDPIENR